MSFSELQRVHGPQFPHFEPPKKTKTKDTKSTEVALIIIKFLGNLLLNLATFGIYGILSMFLEDLSIKKLESKTRTQKKSLEKIVFQLRDVMKTISQTHEENVTKKAHLHEIQKTIDALIVRLKTSPETDSQVHVKLNRAEIALREGHGCLRAIQNGHLQERSEDKGWAKPAYTIKSTDPMYIPFSQTPERKVFDKCYTMEDLLKAAFKVTISALLQNKAITFNRSSKIFEETVKISKGVYQKKHLSTIDTIYKIMAFNLIEQAEFERSDTDAHLVLNNQGLKVSSSQPFWVKIGKFNRAIYKHHDAWTPLGDLSNGVDPISIKLLLTMLTNRDKNALLSLLHDAVTPNNDESLKKAKDLRDSPCKSGVVLKTLESLISDLAGVLQLRYQEALDPLWREFFNDTNAIPFFKGTYVGTVDQDDELKMIFEWHPEKLPIASLHRKIAEDLMETKKLIAPIWKNIQDVLAHPMKNSEVFKKTSDLKQLRAQYWQVHLGINDHGCLFSALAVSLFQGSSKKSDINPQRIKDFLADWLESGGAEHEDIQTIIAIETEGLGTYDYVLFLRGNVTNLKNDELGILEIKLLCKAMEIHVEVFTNEGIGHHNVKDGLMTSSVHYGTNSKEKIILCCGNLSWYALFPIVREPREDDAPELKSALLAAHNYWGRNNLIEYHNWRGFKHAHHQ